MANAHINMITIDIESSGLDPNRHCMVSLGAVDYLTGDEFYQECRIYPESAIDDFALGVNGFTRDQITDPTKPWPHEVLASFIEWSAGREPLLAGQQVGAFDILFLKAIAFRMAFKWPWGHRSVDLHSVSYAVLGKSLSLDGILEAVGLLPEPKPHNALTGARLERDAFKRLLGPLRRKS